MGTVCVRRIEAGKDRRAVPLAEGDGVPVRLLVLVALAVHEPVGVPEGTAPALIVELGEPVPLAVWLGLGVAVRLLVAVAVCVGVCEKGTSVTGYDWWMLLVSSWVPTTQPKLFRKFTRTPPMRMAQLPLAQMVPPRFTRNMERTLKTPPKSTVQLAGDAEPTVMSPVLASGSVMIMLLPMPRL